jgi:hypothetical protein
MTTSEVTDIFIKTYHKDFIWLPYCLKSIQKYSSGFRNIVIVSDNDGHKIPDEYLIPNSKVYYVDVPKIYPIGVEMGIGYLWQQIVKLSWYKYTDADAVLLIDSDTMFTCPTTPDMFKINSKFVWFYRLWKDADRAICHKQNTDFMLQLDTKYEGMFLIGFFFRRNTTLALEEYLCRKHQTPDIWSIIMKHNIKKMSEFNIYASFIHHFNRTEYTQIVNPDWKNYHNNTIYFTWSWGGLTPDDKKKREEILNA